MPDPNILFMSRPAQGVGTGYENALISKLKQNEVAQMPMKNRLLEAQTQASELTAEDAQYLSNFRDMAVDNRKLSAMLDTGDYLGAESLLSQRAARLQEQKIDNSDTLKGLEMLRGGNIDQLRSQSQLIEQTANDLGIFEGIGGTPAGVLEFEHLTQGLTQEQKDKARRVNLGLDPRAGESADERIARDRALALAVAQSQGQIAGSKEGAEQQQKSIYEPGRAGQVAIASETGKLETGIKLGGKAQAVKDSASQAVKMSGEAYEKLAPIKQNIALLDEGISLIDQGAGTGAVERLLPSFREASVKLDNLQSRLGLNVIQTTTFGALSGAELRFALDTGLPKGLDDVALKDWMIDKKEAQTKLVNYLEDVAAYLGKPGNTVSGYIESKRNQRGSNSGAGRAGAAAVAPQAGPSIDDLVNQYGD